MHALPFLQVLDPYPWTPGMMDEEFLWPEKNNRSRDWTQDDVRTVLPKLRTMDVIENAWLDIERECLVVRTRKGKLKHKASILPLSQIDIRIPLKGDTWITNHNPKFKHVGSNLARTFRPHPTMGKRRIGGDSFIYYCIGDYISDYRKAHDKNVYETVIVLLTMLQTIKRDSDDTSLILFGAVTFALLAVVSYITYWLITMHP